MPYKYIDYVRKYRDKNKERLKEYRRQYYLDNRERIRVRDSTPEKRIHRAEINRKRYKENPFYHLLYLAEKRAEARGLEFNLRVEDITMPEKCPIFGIPLVVAETDRNDNSPSLDRIDNKKGYTVDNVQVISWKANRLKYNASLEDLVTLGKWAENELSNPQ